MCVFTCARVCVRAQGSYRPPLPSPSWASPPRRPRRPAQRRRPSRTATRDPIRVAAQGASGPGGPRTETVPSSESGAGPGCPSPVTDPARRPAGPGNGLGRPAAQLMCGPPPTAAAPWSQTHKNRAIFFWISSVVISRLQDFNSWRAHPTSTVLEHLELGQGPRLGHMCWYGTWA